MTHAGAVSLPTRGSVIIRKCVAPTRILSGEHRLGVHIETLLHGFERVFVFPSCDPPFGICRAARFEGTARTCRRPIATQRIAILLVRVPVGQLLTRRAAVDVLCRQMDEILLAVTAAGWLLATLFQVAHLL